MQLLALANNLANFLQRFALPQDVQHWSLSTQPEKLVTIGAQGTRHAKDVKFQLAEVAVHGSMEQVAPRNRGRFKENDATIAVFRQPWRAVATGTSWRQLLGQEKLEKFTPLSTRKARRSEMYLERFQAQFGSTPRENQVYNQIARL